jgi:hypothetical protein
MTGRLTAEDSILSISGLASGIYILKIGEERRHAFKVVKE